MLQKLFVLFFLMQTLSLTAQDSCELIFTGKVIDDHDDSPLIGAVVKLGEQVTVTNIDGMFTFEKICASVQTLQITHIDCEPLQQEINFTESLTKTYYLEHHSHVIEEIEIHATAKRGELAKASETITDEELDEKKGKSFGELLEGTKGLSLLKTGSTITKPVINGLHSQRILLVNNDMRMEGQQWGLEHAPEIDPFAVHTVSVIQGAGSVEYGADGIGGVVLVEPTLLPDAYGVIINPQLTAFSNGRGGSVSLDVLGKENILGLPLSFQMQGSLKKMGNLKAPNYYLDNSGITEANFMLRGGYIGDLYGVEAKLSQYNSELGILTDSHIGNETDLLNIIENGRPFVNRGFSYDILRPRQEILHEIGQIKGYKEMKFGKVEVVLSRQYNRRAEFDRSNEKPGLRLKTETYNGTASLKHRLGERVHGKFGLQAQNQAYKANGFYLIPEYNQQAWGAFLFEKYDVNEKLTAEAGLRYDWKHYEYFIPFNEFRRLDDSNILYKKIEGDIGTKTKSFNNLYTGSFGLSWNANKQTTLSSYIGVGARQPLPNELYSDGVHHGTALWEVGNPDLGIERSTNLQVNAVHEKEDYKLSVNGFLNNVSNFSYLIPSQDLDPIFTIRGTFPVHEMRQSNVSMLGINYSAEKALHSKWIFDTSGSFLWANDKRLNQPLIYMPANRLFHHLTYKPNETWNAKVGLQQVFEQKRIPDETVLKDYTTPPSGYSLVDLKVNYTTALFENKLSFSLIAENVLNKEYKDYLDRFRYFAEAPGQNFGIRINYKIK